MTIIIAIEVRIEQAADDTATILSGVCVQKKVDSLLGNR